MRKLIYTLTAMTFILAASSCTKKCVQCEAKDKRNVTVDISQTICEHDFNRKKFEDRYKEQFKDYAVACNSAD